jgi:hypothetical protein
VVDYGFEKVISTAKLKEKSGVKSDMLWDQWFFKI